MNNQGDSPESRPRRGQTHDDRDMVPSMWNEKALKPNASITWNRDWDSYKRRMKAAGILNGFQKALKKGEALASKSKKEEEVEKWPEDIVESSERLAAVLVLSLESTRGPQQSIVVNRSSAEEEDGISMWADLVRHFEKGLVDLKIADLQKEWEMEAMRQNEHPSELCGRLVAINSKLKNLRVGFNDGQLQSRFVAALERDTSGTYKLALQQYRGAQITGNGWDMATLLEFLTHVCESEKRENKSNPVMKGLATPRVSKCVHCKRAGHNEEDCWVKYPSKMPIKRNIRQIKCCGCGKSGHYKKDCTRHLMAANVKLNESETVIDCYYESILDTACSCHVVTSLGLLERGTITHANERIIAANGSEITLTHKGKRSIITKYGKLQLSNVYYAKELKFNLISVPMLIKEDVKVVFGNNTSSIEKNGCKIYLVRVNNLWTLPETKGKRPVMAASLRMERGGKADAETWHKRLGHVSNYKLKEMIDKGSVPKSAEGYEVG